MLKRILALLVFVCLAQTVFAFSALTTNNVNLRLEPSITAKIIKVIRKNSRITVDACGISGWCRVRAGGRLGFMRHSYIRQVQALAIPTPSTPTSPPGKGYVNSQGNWTPSPVYADSEPSGASAQCRDGTYSFSVSRRGTCSYHGGVARWL
jgi:uncharacterized protein YraI